MGMGRFWTTAEARELQELRSRRVPTTEIAEILGRTPDAIYAFLRYIPATANGPPSRKRSDRLPPKPKRQRAPGYNHWTRDEIGKLVSMARDGCTADEVAREIGRQPKSVRSKAAHLNIKFLRRYLEPETAHYHQNAKEGSTKLLEAMLALAA